MLFGVLRLVLFLLVAYGLICLLVYYAQERLIFVPERNGPGTRYNFGLPFEELRIQVEGATLHALYFSAAAIGVETKGIIVYFHGNAGSLRTWGGVAPDLVPRGYDLLIVDYRGYGQSTGQIENELQLHRDMDAVYAVARARYEPDKIILFGRSLGAPLAARLAAQHTPRLLILEAPFYSIEAMARRMLPFIPTSLLKYPMKTHAWLEYVESPILILHGTADEVVPFADGERLLYHVKSPTSFHAIEGGRHNDLARFSTYQAALDMALGPRR